VVYGTLDGALVSSIGASDACSVVGANVCVAALVLVGAWLVVVGAFVVVVGALVVVVGALVVVVVGALVVVVVIGALVVAGFGTHAHLSLGSAYPAISNQCT